MSFVSGSSSASGGGLGITVIGLDKALNFLNKFPQNYRTERKTINNKIADSGVKTFKGKAHVITGKMKNSIKKGKVNENLAEVTASIKYSGYENKRGGNHAFFDDGVKQITDQAKKEYISATERAISKR